MPLSIIGRADTILFCRYKSFVSFKDYEKEFTDDLAFDVNGLDPTCVDSDPAYFENLANVSYYFYIW